VHVYTPAPKNKQKDKFRVSQLMKIKYPTDAHFPIELKAKLLFVQ